MAFNTSYSSEERFLVDPKDLLFTQPDIKSTFTDPTYPSVRETASLIRDGQFSPDDFGPLHVSIDEHGNWWSDNNRRLFAFREAGLDLVPVVFDGCRRPKNSLKGKLSDPNFMPRIRGEASRVRIPPTPTSSGWNGYQMQKEPEPSYRGSLSAGYRKRQPYNSHEDEEDEYELGARFSQLAIKSTFTHPTRREPASSKQSGEVNPDVFNQSHVVSNFDPNEFWNPSCRFYTRKEDEDDSVPVGFNGNWRGMNAVQSKPNDPAYMPRISGRGSWVRCPPPLTSGWNGYQMEKGTSVMGSVSAGYSTRELYNRHEEGEVQYKYWYNEEEVDVDYEYTVSYEDDGEVGQEYQVWGEAKDDEKCGYESPFKYEDEDVTASINTAFFEDDFE